MKKLIIIILTLFACKSANANYLADRGFLTTWCSEQGGVLKFIVPDKTRVGCFLPEYAVTFYSNNETRDILPETFNLAYKTGKKPALVFVLEEDTSCCLNLFQKIKRKQEDQRRLCEFRKMAKELNIKLWTIKYSSKQRP